MAFGSRRIICSPETESYWQAQSRYSDSTIEVAPALSASKATLQWKRTTPAGTQEDLCSINVHMGIVAGATCVFLDDTQKAAAEVDLKAYMDALAGMQNPGFSSHSIVWHDHRAGEPFYGPADRVTTYATAVGSGPGTRLPDQVACSVTMRTSSRKHWGRVYVPGLGSARFDATYGRFLSSTCDALASTLRDLYSGLEGNTASTTMVVYSTAHQAALTIDEIVCDDVVDIIRRRRAKAVNYRKIIAA